MGKHDKILQDVFAYPGVVELIDLQPDKKDHSKAKSYQVRQVRKFICTRKKRQYSCQTRFREAEAGRMHGEDGR